MPRKPLQRAWPLLPIAFCVLLAWARAGLCAPGLDDADHLRLTGRYDEARTAYGKLAAREPVAAAIGTARCLDAVGETDRAAAVLAAAAKTRPAAAGLLAERARLAFERGDYPAAQRDVDAALSADPDHCGARWIGAELDRVSGRLDEADRGYLWFVRYYNARQDSIRDPESLRWIGLAAAQYARWHRNSGQFSFIVNTLYPEALKLDPEYWPAHYEAALLYIEKYNRPQALAELEAAAAINPKAAELYAARAWVAFQTLDFDGAGAALDTALAINPNLVRAWQLRADVAMQLDGPRGAIEPLERARALNPADERTLGRLAAAYGAADGLREDPSGTRMGKAIDEAVKRNPHCGTFFAALGEALDLIQKYPYAARYYEESRRRMPQLITVPGQLGLVRMRLGDEAGARGLLAEAYEMDPFNVRVVNVRKVLDLLAGYDSLETPHFVIRYDRSRDSLLAAYAARLLEDSVYPEITGTLHFEPPGKSLFEIFSSSGGTSGHGWFSARMVGLPFIGTVGACAGKMVAITSPNDMHRPYNWARVLRHEFVHVVNLQQTDFDIPHWFTEGLAVYYEGATRPAAWKGLLAARAKAGRLFDLKSINMGFVRPSSSQDWTLAYAQAELYAQYMVHAYGDGALAKMIAAYADNLNTAGALKRSFGVDEDAFERGYRGYLDGLVSGYGTSGDAPPPLEGLAVLRDRAEREPKNPEALAQLGRGYLRTGLAFRARHYARQALDLDPRDQFAAWVLAQALLAENDSQQAAQALRDALDPEHPFEPGLDLLARLALNEKNMAETERLCRIGAERFPSSTAWPQMMAAVYRESGDKEKLAATLAELAAGDADDFGIRMELTDLAAGRDDFAAAARWAGEAIDIDVRSAEAHAALARAKAALGSPGEAISEFDVALSLKPEAREWRMDLARACVTARQPGRARDALDELLRQDPHDAEARALRDSLGS